MRGSRLDPNCPRSHRASHLPEGAGPPHSGCRLMNQRPSSPPHLQPKGCEAERGACITLSQLLSNDAVMNAHAVHPCVQTMIPHNVACNDSDPSVAAAAPELLRSCCVLSGRMMWRVRCARTSAQIQQLDSHMSASSKLLSQRGALCRSLNCCLLEDFQLLPVDSKLAQSSRCCAISCRHPLQEGPCLRELF